jgi:hypothetical protein
MKDRIKKFYKEHDESIKTFFAGVGVGLVVGAVAIARGMDVQSGDIYKRDDGEMIMVIHHKNNMVTNLKYVEPVN